MSDATASGVRMRDPARLGRFRLRLTPRTVTIEGATREGPAAQVLLDETQGADLLVVGSRGLGGFSGLLLGSVSQQCVHHATCPVLIAREPAPAATAG
jgi:nucleotide-binding universal stress UspA family protein